MTALSESVPRGIRNHNPGNLRRSPDPWVGLSPEQTDPDFLQFSESVFGIRALARTLFNYQAKHDLKTAMALIERWAPASENDTRAYVKAVSSELDVEAETPLDLSDRDELAALVKAIIRHECGQQPYSDSTIEAAVRLALA